MALAMLESPLLWGIGGIVFFYLTNVRGNVKYKERGLALRRMLENPGQIGMIAPSSKALYNRMVKKALEDVDISNEDLFIVELGPGTGVGTQALLDYGINPSQIVCVELDPELQKYMTKKFPQVNTVLGDATNLEKILGVKFGKVAVIISGIPLKNLSKEQVNKILKSSKAALKAGGKFSQFTYSIIPTSVIPGFVRKFGGFVLANLPPAFIWIMTKTC